MPLEYSKGIPSMFARVYTAPPQEVFFDMYENDLSFDDAAKNLLDKEMEQGYDTDSIEEILGAEDPMSILGNDDVEKAIYQIGLAQEQGMDPAGMTTPYGPGLAQEQLDQIINEYPGINAGVEWRTMDDHYHDAEDILNDPGSGSAIDNMVNAAVSRAEDEGAIDSLGDIFKAFGDQLGRAGQGASEAHVAERTKVDPDTGDLFLGPSIGPNAPPNVIDVVEGTSNAATDLVSGGTTTSPISPAQTPPLPGTANTTPAVVGSGDGSGTPTIYPGWDARNVADWQGMSGLEMGEDYVLQLQLDIILEKAKDGVTAGMGAVILQDLHGIATYREPRGGAGGSPQDPIDPDLMASAAMAWMEDKSWEGKLADMGMTEAQITEVQNQIRSVFGEDGTQDTTTWATGEWQDPETRAQVTAKELERNLAIADLMEKNEWERPEAEEHWDKMPPEKQEAYAKEAELGAPTEEEMRTRHNRSLSRSFYEVLYAQPWGGQAEFQEILPTMLSETKTLFFIANAIPGVDGLKEKYGQDPPKEGEWGAEYKAGEEYKKFVQGYLQNPDVYRKGGWIAGRIKRINDLLKLKISNPDELTPAYGGKWKDQDVADWAWVQPLFAGETKSARTNRYNLIAMVASQGKQGYMANIVKAGTVRAMQHYENMGLGDSEIFTMMTRIFGETGGRSAQAIPVTAKDDPRHDPSDPGTGYRPGDYPGTDPAQSYDFPQPDGDEDQAQREADYARGHIYNYYGDEDGDIASEAEQAVLSGTTVGTGIDKTLSDAGLGGSTGTDLDMDKTLSDLGLGGSGEVDPGMVKPLSTLGGTSTQAVTTDELINQIMQQNREQQTQAPTGGAWTPREAMINNRMTQGASMQEAIAWANRELAGFPVQPTSFTAPGTFERSFGDDGLAATLSQPGAMGGTPTGLTEDEIAALLGEKGTSYDIGSLPYRGQTLTQEEIDELLGAYDERGYAYPM